MAALNLVEASVLRVNEEQTTALEVEKRREARFKALAEGLMLLLAHKAAEGLEDQVGSLMGLGSSCAHLDSFEDALEDLAKDLESLLAT